VCRANYLLISVDKISLKIINIVEILFYQSLNPADLLLIFVFRFFNSQGITGFNQEKKYYQAKTLQNG